MFTQQERKATHTIVAWILRHPTLQGKRDILRYAKRMLPHTLLSRTLNEAALSQIYASESKN